MDIDILQEAYYQYIIGRVTDIANDKGKDQVLHDIMKALGYNVPVGWISDDGLYSKNPVRSIPTRVWTAIYLTEN